MRLSTFGQPLNLPKLTGLSFRQGWTKFHQLRWLAGSSPSHCAGKTHGNQPMRKLLSVGIILAFMECRYTLIDPLLTHIARHPPLLEMTA
jgi:hypothetical protein